MLMYFLHNISSFVIATYDHEKVVSTRKPTDCGTQATDVNFPTVSVYKLQSQQGRELRQSTTTQRLPNTPQYKVLAFGHKINNIYALQK